MVRRFMSLVIGVLAIVAIIATGTASPRKYAAANLLAASPEAASPVSGSASDELGALPGGFSLDLVASGTADDLPRSGATLTLERITLDPNESRADRTTGPVLIEVENGLLTITSGSGRFALAQGGHLLLS